MATAITQEPLTKIWGLHIGVFDANSRARDPE